MDEKDIAFRLISYAIKKQKIKPDEYVEANEDLEIKSLGNARIANSLESLGKYGIVADVQPTLSEHGLGFAYRISHQLVEELTSDNLISQRIDSLFGLPSSDIDLSLTNLLNKCERTKINIIYRDDLLASLKELRLCFAYECYIACLALSGKLLEICLKQLLIDNNIQFDNRLMIGQLLGKLRDAGCEKYLDQSLTEMGTIINKSRIPAVHATEKVPVPSREQAAMVINAVIDTINRVIINP